MQHLRWLGWFLDSSIRLPGGFRIGWDGIIGLVPGVGDVVGASLAAYIVLAGARLGAPPSVLARMTLNVLLETVMGTIPLVGDVFDLAFKANVRNLRLLEQSLAAPAAAGSRSTIFLALTAVAVVAALVATAVAVIVLLVAAWRSVFG